MSIKDWKAVSTNVDAKSLKEGMEELRRVLASQPTTLDSDTAIGIVGCPHCGAGFVFRTGTERICGRCKKDIFTGSEPVEK